jgi:hypothetical protein
MIGIRNFYLKKKKEKGGKTISLSHSLITATNTLYRNLSSSSSSSSSS